MTTTSKCLLEAKDAENAQTTQYTSPASGKGTIIDKMTACNHSAAAAKLSVNVVANAGSAANTNLVVETVSIASGATYTFPELTYHVLNAGDFVSTLADTASAIAIRISGRELT